MARRKRKVTHYRGYQKHLKSTIERCERECDYLKYKALDADLWSKKGKALTKMFHKCQRECQGAKVGRRWRKAANQALHMPEWSQR